MKLSTIRKSGGIAIIAGAVLFTLWTVCWTFCLPIAERMKDFSLLVKSPNWIWVCSIAFPGVFLTAFGFTAIYSKIYKESGILGFLGYILITIAYILQAAQISWEIFVYPAMIAHEPSVALLRDRIFITSPMVSIFRMLFDGSILLGVITFGTALIRSKEFPKAGGILFVSGAIIYAVGPMIYIYLGILGVLMLSAGMLILGLKLLGDQTAE